MNFNNMFFNQQYVNPTYYHQMMLQQHYNWEQNKKIMDAVKAVHDLQDALNAMDAYHQEIAFYACIAEIGRMNGWK